LCDHYGIEFETHHDAMCDVIACLEIFKRLTDEFGPLELAVWAPRPSSHHGRKRIFSALGLVNGSQETVEHVLERAEELGFRGDPSEIENLEGLKVKVSGVTPGYARDEILGALKRCGMKATDGKPARSTQYLAIGDNVGQSKLDAAFNGSSAVKIVTTGELPEVINRFGEAK